jgi:hypothetical protein
MDMALKLSDKDQEYIQGLAGKLANLMNETYYNASSHAYEMPCRNGEALVYLGRTSTKGIMSCLVADCNFQSGENFKLGIEVEGKTWEGFTIDLSGVQLHALIDHHTDIYAQAYPVRPEQYEVGQINVRTIHDIFHLGRI